MVKYTVLPNVYSKGPYGIGDPDDKSLRHVEKEILIPNIMRKIAQDEKCADLKKEFGECCINEGLLMWLKCRPITKKYTDCLMKWYYNEEFRRECTRIYLEERSEYRRTNISKTKDIRKEIHEAKEKAKREAMLVKNINESK